MLIYRLKSKLDGEYWKSEIKHRLNYPVCEIWRNKKQLYEFFIDFTVFKLQLTCRNYYVEMENTRTGKLKRTEILDFFKFF